MKSRLECIDALLLQSDDPERVIDRLYNFALLLKGGNEHAETVFPPAL